MKYSYSISVTGCGFFLDLGWPACCLAGEASKLCWTNITFSFPCWLCWNHSCIVNRCNFRFQLWRYFHWRIIWWCCSIFRSSSPFPMSCGWVLIFCYLSRFAFAPTAKAFSAYTRTSGSAFLLNKNISLNFELCCTQSFIFWLDIAPLLILALELFCLLKRYQFNLSRPCLIKIIISK